MTAVATARHATTSVTMARLGDPRPRDGRSRHVRRERSPTGSCRVRRSESATAASTDSRKASVMPPGYLPPARSRVEWMIRTRRCWDSARPGDHWPSSTLPAGFGLRREDACMGACIGRSPVAGVAELQPPADHGTGDPPTAALPANARVGSFVETELNHFAPRPTLRPEPTRGRNPSPRHPPSGTSRQLSGETNHSLETSTIRAPRRRRGLS